jgi:hypothetical protein
MYIYIHSDSYAIYALINVDTSVELPLLWKYNFMRTKATSRTLSNIQEEKNLLPKHIKNPKTQIKFRILSDPKPHVHNAGQEWKFRKPWFLRRKHITIPLSKLYNPYHQFRLSATLNLR